MKHSTWSAPISDAATTERTWRLDAAPVDVDSGKTSEATEIQPGSDPGSIVAGPAPARRSTAGGAMGRWHEALRDWLHARLDHFRGGKAKFEDVLHQFAATIAAVDDPAIVESALLRLARQMAPASWIELVPGAAPPVDEGPEAEACGGERPADRWSGPTGQMVLDVPLRSGASICGRLRFRSRSGGRSPLKTQTIQRLTTLCTIAASAIECVAGHADWPRDDQREQPGALPSGPPSLNGTQAASPLRPAISLHDATFLNAVLPFALNQARRHREALSLLCIAIDRKSSIQELLGRAEMDRLVRHVGEITGSLIRASDIIARLDDDRIIAVLPRAPRGGALRAAENICRAVADKTPADCDTPHPTVSIGVATFPSCGDNVYSLFDAADEALARAQSHGRNQAALAPAKPAPAPSRAKATAIGCSR